MTKYLIQVPHEAEHAACERAVRIFLSSGSHFLANADWGCADGEHKAWMVVEVTNKEEAYMIVPPNYRPQAKIVALNRFSMTETDEIQLYHAP